MIIFRSLFIFFVFSSLLHANENELDDLFESSLENTQSLVSTIVGGAVSVITGEWIDAEVDFILPGPEPLKLGRLYSQGYHPQSAINIEELGENFSTFSSRNIGSNWYFNYPTPLYLEYSSKGYLGHPSGAKTCHKAEDLGDEVLFMLDKRTGLTNCASSEMSARTNMNNAIFWFDRSLMKYISLSGSGSRTVFEDGKKALVPLFEKRPSGNHLLFKNEEIRAVDALQTTCFSQLNFRCLSQGKKLKIEASNGQKAWYSFDLVEGEVTKPSVSASVEEKEAYQKACERQKQYYLSHVDYSHKPSITYSYKSDQRLSRKSYPNDRFLAADYYKCKKLRSDEKDENKHGKDHLHGRVKQLFAPVGNDATPIATYTFVYHFNDPYPGEHQYKKDPKLFEEREKNPKYKPHHSGYTEVLNALGHKRVYHYNEKHRPTRIEKFLGHGYHSAEEFIWDEEYNWPDNLPQYEAGFFDYFFSKKKPSLPNVGGKGFAPAPPPKEKERKFSPSRSFIPPAKEVVVDGAKIPLETELATPPDLKKALTSHFLLPDVRSYGVGNLIGKIVKDATGAIHHARFFDYDEKGNVITEFSYGNFTGTCITPIALNYHQRPIENGVECYRKHYSYSQGALNLLTTEKEDNGKTILYHYLPKTDLKTSRIILEEDQIKFREFYEYDKNTSLTKIIKDDGETLDRNNLTGVSYRQIRYLTPRQVAPFGLPEKIEEKYLDTNTGRECLLKTAYCDYSKEGRLIKQDHYDSQGYYCYTLEWDYDSHGNLLREKNALGEVIIRTYDENDNLASEQSSDSQTFFTYDHSNRLIKTVEYHGNKCHVTRHQYDLMGHRISTIDRYGQETRFVYDDLGRLIKTLFPSVANEQGILIEPVITTTYDVLDRPISTTDAKGHVTCTTYNTRGKPTLIQYPDGTQESFEYSLDGYLIKSVAQNGTETRYIRDCFGRVLLEEVYADKLLSRQTFTYKGSHLISTVDPEGIETIYQYDGAGRKVYEKRGETQIHYAYDNLSRLAKKSYGTYVEAYQYDYLNRVTEERIEDSYGTVYHRLSYKYDSRGNRTEVREDTPSGLSKSETIYDSEDRPTLLIDPQGYSKRIDYDETFNAYGQRVARQIATDPQGRKTTQIFDVLGRLSTIEKRNNYGVLLSKQEMFYDASGNRTKVLDSVISESNLIREICTLWEYNNMNQEITLTEAVGTAEQRITSTLYNRYGQKSRLIKPDGVNLEYTYDSLGRLASFTSSDKTLSYKYEYNRNHQVTQVNDGTVRQYDSYGRLRSENLAHGPTLQYGYDHLNRLTTLTLPDQSKIQYRYKVNNLKEVERNGLVHKYHFSKGQHISSTLIGYAGKAYYLYDLSQRPTSIRTPTWSETITYDHLGRITEYDAQNQHYAFTYDELDSLTSEKSWIKHNYKTDSLYNRLKKDDKEYALNALNQIIAQGNNSYTYDLNGNLIQAGNQTYSYDALNRLISVTQNGITTHYTYDAFNRRLTKRHNGQEYQFLYQGQDEIGMIESGQITQLRVLGSGIEAEIGAAVAIELNDQSYAPIHDHNGNVTCLIDVKSGKPFETYAYTAFGEQKDSQYKNPWRYASKRLDEETGFIYFGRRYYSPELGRWITPDPIGYGDGPNLYAYLHHNPLASHDAYGLVGEAYRDSCECASLAPEFTWEHPENNSGCNYNESNEQASNEWDSCWDCTTSVWNGYSDPSKTLENRIWQVLEGCYSIWTNGFTAFSYESFKKESYLMGFECCGVVLSALPIGRAVQGTKNVATGTFRFVKETVTFSTKVAKVVTDEIKCYTIFSRQVNGVVNQSRKTVDMLSKAGKVLDRNGLTKAGRALDKHGNRIGSPFPQATGNVSSKNTQGQFQLDDILTNPKSEFILNSEKKGFEIYAPDGRGAYFRNDGTLKGFVER